MTDTIVQAEAATEGWACRGYVLGVLMVLDVSAVLAPSQLEAVSDLVEPAIAGANMSTVSSADVVDQGVERGMVVSGSGDRSRGPIPASRDLR